MQNFLQDIIVNNLFAFILILTRIGTIVSLMPGIGDSFVPKNVKAMFAISFSFILTPVISMNITTIPSSIFQFAMLVVTEAMIGVFIGTILKLFIAALDVAGAVASAQSGLSNAMVFNPASSSQGSIIGAVYAVTGITLIMITDMHHYMLSSLVYSYNLFPTTAGMPDIGTMADAIAMTVNLAFRTGVEMALPFVIVVTILHIGTGLLGRLMPQMQIFFVAIPIQLALTLLMLSLTLSFSIIYWLSRYEELINKVLS